MTGHFLTELEIIFDKVCVLVTAAFALTLCLASGDQSDLSPRCENKETKLLVFLLLGLIEGAAVGKTGWFNHRIIAACAAGLLAGPGLGAIVAVFVTWMAVAFDGRPLEPVGISCRVVASSEVGCTAGATPSDGILSAAAVSVVRDGLIFLCAPEATPDIQMLGQME